MTETLRSLLFSGYADARNFTALVLFTFAAENNGDTSAADLDCDAIRFFRLFTRRTDEDEFHHRWQWKSFQMMRKGFFTNHPVD